MYKYFSSIWNFTAPQTIFLSFFFFFYSSPQPTILLNIISNTFLNIKMTWFYRDSIITQKKSIIFSYVAFRILWLNNLFFFYTSLLQVVTNGQTRQHIFHVTIPLFHIFAIVWIYKFLPLFSLNSLPVDKFLIDFLLFKAK